MPRGKKGNIDTAKEWEVKSILTGSVLEKYKKIKKKIGTTSESETVKVIINRYYELSKKLERI